MPKESVPLIAGPIDLTTLAKVLIRKGIITAADLTSDTDRLEDVVIPGVTELRSNLSAMQARVAAVEVVDTDARAVRDAVAGE